MMARKRTMLVDRKAFLDWYFSDEGARGSLADAVIEQFYYTGRNKVAVDLELIANNVGYLPKRLILNPDELLPEDQQALLEDGRIDAPSSRYMIKLVKRRR